MNWFKITFFVCLAAILFLAGAMLSRWDMGPARVINAQAAIIEEWWEAWRASMPAETVNPDISAALKDVAIEWEEDEAPPGYNAVVVRYQNSAYLMDMGGKIVHQWNMPFSKAFPDHPQAEEAQPDYNVYFEKVHIFPNGNLLGIYHAMGTAPFGYGMVMLDKDSNIVWKLAENTHHDFYISPENGHIFALTQKFDYAPDLIRQYIPYEILYDTVMEISSEGKPLASFSIPEAFTRSAYRGLLFSAYDRGPEWDLMHTNSIERLEPAFAQAFPQWPVGSFLISLRGINTVAVIDPEGQKVLWAYNGLWKNQHAAHFTTKGTILLMDNRGLVMEDKEFSRILEINPNTLAVEYEYNSFAPRFYTNAYGRVQRLKNGNTLVTETLGRRVFELSPARRIVWQMQLPSITITRFPDLAMLDEDKMNDKTQEDMPGALPNLATAIVYAERYTPEQLPFLKEALH